MSSNTTITTEREIEGEIMSERVGRKGNGMRASIQRIHLKIFIHSTLFCVAFPQFEPFYFCFVSLARFVYTRSRCVFSSYTCQREHFKFS